MNALLVAAASLLIIFFSGANAVIFTSQPGPKYFDVRRYGAVSGGRVDNAKAFLRAWNDACAYPGRSRIWIPIGTFRVNQVTFEGPCRGTMAFLIKGTLIASTNAYGNNWIAFRYLNYLSVKGGGYVDGQGPSAWPYNDCKRNSNCRTLPPSLTFDFVNNSKIQNLHSLNSKSVHFDLFSCHKVNITEARLTAPADSPNTDGIRIGASSQIYISRSTIRTGDDCIALLTGSQDIDISEVVCGPGHGISIGSIGRSGRPEVVGGIRVQNCTLSEADNGVRIKTWAHSVYSQATDITFENILMNNVRNPIIIDQQYCPNGSGCQGGQQSKVQIYGVTFKNIHGTSNTKDAVKLMCSGALPCKNVKLIDIDLTYMGGEATAMCYNVLGAAYGKVNPEGCL